MISGSSPGLARDSAIVPAKTALLVIDVQNRVVDPSQDKLSAEFLDDAKQIVIPNIKRLMERAREAGIEVVFTVIENLTLDGRDRSLDYKHSGFFVAKGSWEAKVVEALAPGADEMVIPKTSSSLFNSTNFDYLMRNIGIETIIATGFLTDQCVDHTIRDGADRGYRMIAVSDACGTHTRERHAAALKAHKGYCRMETTESLLAALQ